MSRGDVAVTWTAGRPVDLHRTLAPYRRGRSDPTSALGPGEFWRAVRTPEGPATVRLRLAPAARAEGQVHADLWGPGASWTAGRVPSWLGAADDVTGFAPDHPLLAAVWRRMRGWRVARSELVLDALVPAVLEQKVTGAEARRSYAWLVRRFGAVAPGPPPPGRDGSLRVPPDACGWALVPSWDWHRAGVGPQRSATVVRAARSAAALERCVGLDGAAAATALRTIPGVGAWTAAEVRARALGDPDAVSVGDAHVPRLVVWALAGRVSDSDEEMLEVLRPYAGHRYRVQRLLEMAAGDLPGLAAPRFGARYAPQDMRAL